MVDRDRATAVADAIESRSVEGLGFSMSSYASQNHACGTTACLAGWTVAVAESLTPEGLLEVDNESLRDPSRLPIHLRAAKWLGLTDDQAWELFLPSHFMGATQTQGVAVMRYLAREGQVDWEAATALERSEP